MKKLLFFVGILPSLFLAADPLIGSPWFTGPLLTPSPNVVGKNHINVEPYVFYTDTNGRYDKNGHLHDVVSSIQWFEQFPIQIGVAEKLEFGIIPGVITNSKSGNTSTGMSDTVAALTYQLYSSEKTSWIPSMKLGLRVQFPTGKFHNLNPRFDGVDSTGGGCYATTVALTFGKLIELYEEHYLNLRTFFGYTYSFPAHVENFNSYGGGYDTYGVVHPGNVFAWLLGLEYNLSLHWALALDIQFFHANKTSFSGIVGFNEPREAIARTIASMSSPSKEQWSIAPAIEYNFDEHIGIIAGPWVTFAGRNSGAFISGVAAINIFY